mmetsp:Transcript_38820/g.77359  ORF Transcript_38820/g.77359 Transcript_38820/m.77359 type:complete len:83 (+) Transcript_38820:701-949(+)
MKVPQAVDMAPLDCDVGRQVVPWNSLLMQVCQAIHTSFPHSILAELFIKMASTFVREFKTVGVAGLNRDAASILRKFIPVCV